MALVKARTRLEARQISARVILSPTSQVLSLSSVLSQVRNLRRSARPLSMSNLNVAESVCRDGSGNSSFFAARLKIPPGDDGAAAT